MAESRAYRIGLTIILVFTPLARGTTTTRLWALTPVLLVIYTLIFLWLWRVNNSPQYAVHSPQRTPLDRLIFGFAILAVISFAFSIYKHDSFYALLRLLAYVGLYYVIVNNYSRNLRKYLLSLVICVGTGLSIYGLLQYFGFLPHPWWYPTNCLAATYVNHNHFAGYLELVIPVGIGMVFRQRAMTAGKRLLLLAIAIMLTAFVFTQSRGGWASLGISLFVMNMILVKHKMLKRESILVFILLLTLIFALFYAGEGLVAKRMNTLKKVITKEALWNTRINIWKGTLKMIRESPLVGVGIGDFVWGFPRYRPVALNSIRAHYAHNDYLHMAAEMGVFAPVIMVWMLVIVVGRGLRSPQSAMHSPQNHQLPAAAHKPLNPTVLGCAIGVLSLALHNLVDFNFHIPANMILFTVYGAIIMKDAG